MQIKSFKTAPKFAKLQELAIAVQTGDDYVIARALLQLQCDPEFSGPGWQTKLNKLADVFSQKTPQFSIFALGGNSKLPFVSFSTIPGVTCPGAGDCINFCYSYRAWRFPQILIYSIRDCFLLLRFVAYFDNRLTNSECLRFVLIWSFQTAVPTYLIALHCCLT